MEWDSLTHGYVWFAEGSDAREAFPRHYLQVLHRGRVDIPEHDEIGILFTAGNIVRFSRKKMEDLRVHHAPRREY